MLRIFSVENPNDWDDHLPYLMMAYRVSEQKSTGGTPNLLFLQWEFFCPLDLMVGPPPNTLKDMCPIEYIEWVKSAMFLTHEFAFKHLGVATARQKAYYNHRPKRLAYKVGGWIWMFYLLNWTRVDRHISCCSQIYRLNIFHTKVTKIMNTERPCG